MANGAKQAEIPVNVSPTEAGLLGSKYYYDRQVLTKTDAERYNWLEGHTTLIAELLEDHGNTVVLRELVQAIAGFSLSWLVALDTIGRSYAKEPDLE